METLDNSVDLLWQRFKESGDKDARDRLLRLSASSMAVRDAAQLVASGLDQVVDQAVTNHDWTRGISHSAQDVRGLIEGIAKRGTDLAAGTEDVAAAVVFFATCPPYITGQILGVDGGETA